MRNVQSVDVDTNSVSAGSKQHTRARRPRDPYQTIARNSTGRPSSSRARDHHPRHTRSASRSVEAHLVDRVRADTCMVPISVTVRTSQSFTTPSASHWQPRRRARCTRRRCRRWCVRRRSGRTERPGIPDRHGLVAGGRADVVREGLPGAGVHAVDVARAASADISATTGPTIE